MKALVLMATGGLQDVQVRELPEPTLDSPGQVLIRIQAIALNRLDLLVTGGLPGVSYRFPHILGSDGAGTVEQVGSLVSDVAPGDRVMINPTISCGQCSACMEGEHSLCSSLQVLGEHCAGTAAEYIVIPAENLARVPAAMPWPQAAAFSLATLTAWRMLKTRAELRSGETVLIWGIGGGVALASLQIAQLLGARTIVTSGSDAKLNAARALGANATLNHGKTDIAAEVRTLTQGRGADVIVDSVGESSWPSSLRALRRGGRLVICGATSGPKVAMDLRRLFWHQWSILGATLGNRREYGEIVSLAHEGKLWPLVDRVVPLDRALEALGRLDRGEQVGKLVIEVGR